MSPVTCSTCAYFASGFCDYYHAKPASPDHACSNWQRCAEGKRRATAAIVEGLAGKVRRLLKRDRQQAGSQAGNFKSNPQNR